MQYGLYLAASGMLTGMHRMDVHANNLANVETTGFKLDTPLPRQRAPEREESGRAGMPSNKMLERLGGGVLMSRPRVSLAQGILQPTSNSLDVAVQGEGFLVVRDGVGNGPGATAFTRDGRLTLDSTGKLVQASSGRPILDTDDRPITLVDGAPIAIDKSGIVRQGNEIVGQIQLATIENPGLLRKRGENMLAADRATMGRKRAAIGATIEQNSIERSTVDAVKSMMDMSSAERAMTGNAKMISNYDEMMNRAINTFGKMA